MFSGLGVCSVELRVLGRVLVFFMGLGFYVAPQRSRGAHSKTGPRLLPFSTAPPPPPPTSKPCKPSKP